MELQLPFPPSPDCYWSGEGDDAQVMPAGRRYRRDVATAVSASGSDPLDGPVGLHVVFHPPDESPEIDDPIGALIDGLAEGGALDDDAEVVLLYVEWGEQADDGRADVELWQVQA